MREKKVGKKARKEQKQEKIFFSFCFQALMKLANARKFTADQKSSLFLSQH